MLSIEVLRGSNPGFDIEFFHPDENPENRTVRYDWTENFGPCSASCGGGVMTVDFKCSSIRTHRKKSEVSEQMCLGSKPKYYQKSCSNIACPAKWTAGEWSKCTKSCGGGKSTRTISCSQRLNNKDVSFYRSSDFIYENLCKQLFCQRE